MAPVLAQMSGNAIGARFDGDERRAQRIGERAAARIAQCRDMIDIDAEARTTHRFHYPFTRSTLLTTGRARKCEMIVFKCFKSLTSTSIVISRKSAERALMTMLSILAA